MQTMIFTEISSGEVVGAMPVPPCFAPNAAFFRSAEMVGVSGELIDGEVTNPALLLTGAVILDAMRAAMASLN